MAVGKLFLNGFVYDGIGTKSPTDARSRISWLHLQPTDRFLPQPYEQLAEVLRKTGHEDDAKDVLIAKNRDRASRANWYNPIRSWYFLLDITIGYGYQPWYAFWESVGFVAFGAYLFRKAKKAGIMAPTDGGDSPRNGLRFSGFVYSLETFVPLINLAMAEHWLPVGEGKMEFRLGKRTFHVAENGLRRDPHVHKAVGWVLTTLWVGGLTGLIKI